MSTIDAVRAALAEPDTALSQQQVHEIIGTRLQALTSDSELLVTGYFNHSWAPDFLIRSGQREQRSVYLRFDVYDPGFADDLHYLAGVRPIFIDLVPASTPPGERGLQGSQDPLGDLQGDDIDAVLVIDISAVERLADRVEEDVSLRRASHELILGGHGLVDEAAADTIIDSWQTLAAAIDTERPSALVSAIAGLAGFMRPAAALPIAQPLLARETLSRTVDPFTPTAQWVARLIEPTSFSDAQTIADSLKNGTPVVMDVRNTPRDVAKRLVDFASGLTYALDGEVGRMSESVFLLVPEGTARLARREPPQQQTPTFLPQPFYHGGQGSS
jgi:hypothetical protein